MLQYSIQQSCIICETLTQPFPLSCFTPRCSTAQGPSCPTSTRLQTLCTGLRVWLLHPMVTWQWLTLGTTALRCTATCSRPSTDDDTTMYSTRCNDLRSLFTCTANSKLCNPEFTFRMVFIEVGRSSVNQDTLQTFCGVKGAIWSFDIFCHC